MKIHPVITCLALAVLPVFAPGAGAAEAERRDGPPRPPEQREPNDPKARPEQVRQHAEELARTGRPEEAEQVRRKNQEAQRQLQHGRRPDGDQTQRSERREGDRDAGSQCLPASESRLQHGQRAQQPPGRAGENPEQRLRHLREAIEHLHAAGIHEPADALTHQAQEMERQIHAQRAGQQGGHGQPPNEFAQLHGEIAELRKMIEELARQRR